jgi:uncharacterized surface protein with fasciclin (FAS1) repeats
MQYAIPAWRDNCSSYRTDYFLGAVIMTFKKKIARFALALTVVGMLSTQMPGTNNRVLAQTDNYGVDLSRRGNQVIQGAVIGLIGYGLYSSLTGGSAPAPLPTGGGTGPVMTTPTPTNPPAALSGVDPIYDVAGQSSDLSSFKGAVDFASYEEKGADDLVRILRREKDFTVFAPVNSAFARIQSTLDELLKDNKNMQSRATVRGILNYHIVRGRYTMAQLATMNGRTLTTLDNSTLRVSVSGNTVSVNGVAVQNTDLLCTNGIIHPLTGVLQKN